MSTSGGFLGQRTKHLPDFILNKNLSKERKKNPWKRAEEMVPWEIALLFKQAQGPELESQNPNKNPVLGEHAYHVIMGAKGQRKADVSGLLVSLSE